MSSATVIVSASDAGKVVETPRDHIAVASVHETAVAEIAGMIRTKYEDEGLRNFAIGKRAFEHAQWQRGNFAGYTSEDFDNLMNRVRDDVRIYVAISPKSIKLGEWVRCHVLRELVRQAKGDDVADKLSFFEYRNVYGKALAFSKNDVEGSLVDGWLDFFCEIATIRMSPVTRNGQPVLNDDGTPMLGRVSSEDFMTRMAKHEADLAAAKAPKLSAEQTAALEAVEKAKAKTKATSKAVQTITETVSDALSGGLMPVEAVLGIVENVARHHNVELPTLGVDPSKMTVADCKVIAEGLFKAGKYAEMIALRDTLDKMVAAVDKARASVASSAPTAPTVKKAGKKAAA